MRIIDKRHDYYDIGMGLAHDPSIVYVREPKNIELSKWGSRSCARRMETVYVGFCDKVYPAFVFSVYKPDKVNVIKGVCYNIEEIDKFVHANLDKNDIEQYEETPKNRRYKSWSFMSKYWQPQWGNRASLISTFERLKDSTYPYYAKLFKEHNSPIFVVNPPENKIHINCLLKPWEFYKVFDPYNAFQEISMYVGGVLLAPVNPVPIPDDETLREIKGFTKFSFRKDKSN